ncbi:ABC transporter permease (plasmid) [Deinococcus metallilatus]|uniref:Peptide/nickel transport system permease protein n=1 Tax=Deinococcus metallilatus TaxID=1211322 RepID=A0ABR6MYC7_9DEIO|nr:ABC transporter permease [Deinococcus metallilatus]MBB5296955.1 peptide/nickel transport system permease protein [Deinococcus metallilatus]QBY06677.1 ABC transporter permease [Deinococcus metallilatus]GMA15146.1 peptide ABC transporter permease [Deinococcus metallilatus]
MGIYALRRLLISIPLLLVITAIIFTMLQFTPGDPLDAYIPPDQVVTAEQRAIIRHDLGLDQPKVVQYGRWLQHAVQGDLGYRIKNGEPVSRELARRLPPTLLLMGAGLGLGVVLGVLFGVLAAVKRYTFTDNVLTLLAFLGISTPAFLAGLLGLYVFALKLKWFPAGGYQTPGNGSVLDILSHLILPALILSVTYIAVLMRYTRSSILEVIHQDYVRTASAKGVAYPWVVGKHVLRNALIPVVTVIGANVANLIGGAVFLESIFSWPGTGQLYLDAIDARDYPMIMGTTLVLAAVILLANLLTDLLYGLIDPRIRYT